jgi:hypothetical protein
MTEELDCLSCEKYFKAEAFESPVQCPHCKKWFETDFEYIGEGISFWLVKEIIK